MVIAVDFDGTIVEHKYPAIGKEIPFATACLRQLIQDGHKLILWSVREGDLLNDAIKWCEERGVRFYAVNADLDEDCDDHQGTAHFSRKIKADMFIDDLIGEQSILSFLNIPPISSICCKSKWITTIQMSQRKGLGGNFSHSYAD